MPMHFLGINVGSFIAMISLVLFIYILYDQFVNGLTNKANNKSVLYTKSPDFVESNEIFNLNTIKTSSIEFLLTSPPAVHSFNTPAVQS
ncbi:cytochrome c oxidase subunit 1 (mitochondrion) [Nakaseomyces glabratus]|uniref:Cytochrome c oxidase subunit 1 n=1 Tax=Candida glabrata TaxID=5478 RepID=A0A0W0C636_CANGB|nr:cytochrome c oxidase subunit 1 [Nakaseomyces glabratus]KTA94975.1 cytochrome c oxidase subunit 1 [Nakaseomyces glabratus]KTA94976.1 cytochrome c oxidase subunit 1 [Nakaseomyces glabratus]KTB12630.1 cytochrome c oxidase subunit 1 [Nakaseomyces glabratus]KTB26781.1 Cytochrome c oxidase subunit 1 [Nakaseomyces glabratus]